MLAVAGIFEYSMFMVRLFSLVLYKNQPAVVTAINDGKYTIEYCAKFPVPGGKPAVYEQQKVRDKDIATLYEAVPVKTEQLPEILTSKLPDKDLAVQELYELIDSDVQTSTQPVSFVDLCGFAGIDSATGTWNLYTAISSSVYFTTVSDSGCNQLLFKIRSRHEIQQILDKQAAKNREQEIRASFIDRLKKRQLNMETDAQLMQDVEALALGTTDKSRTMKEAGIPETPEKAHKLLLETGIWPIEKNPFPSRFGLSMQSAQEHLAKPPDENRITLSHIAYAIDNAWSSDPDDAIAYDGEAVWVHVADPAATVIPGSSIDTAACNRGTTLYLPEGTARMLAEDCLEDYALGLTEPSRALSFKITLDNNGAVTGCNVLKTWITVRRITYEEADEKEHTPELAPLFDIARKNEQRRLNAGAVAISLPEVHITVKNQKVSIKPVMQTKSASVVREFMLLAGEAAAKFAFKNDIPFPYISQEKPDIPSEIPTGLAGQYRLRRCMRSRNVGVIPRQHAGLGLGMYSQVTSPLRRYSDLAAHEQLRAFIDNRPLLDKDHLLEKIAAGDAAAGAAVRAERCSNMHWTLVYLLQNSDWTGTAVVVEIKGKSCICLIPSLGIETQLLVTRQVQLNDTITVQAGNISIPEQIVTFMQIDN